MQDHAIPRQCEACRQGVHCFDATRCACCRRKIEVVWADADGWISGPSLNTEPVPAEDVAQGDSLILDDGTTAEVTDVRHGSYYFHDGRSQGVAIGWKAGRSSGLLFRRAGDMLYRSRALGGRS